MQIYKLCKVTWTDYFMISFSKRTPINVLGTSTSGVLGSTVLAIWWRDALGSVVHGMHVGRADVNDLKVPSRDGINLAFHEVIVLSLDEHDAFFFTKRGSYFDYLIGGSLRRRVGRLGMSLDFIMGPKSTFLQSFSVKYV